MLRFGLLCGGLGVLLAGCPGTDANGDSETGADSGTSAGSTTGADSGSETTGGSPTQCDQPEPLLQSGGTPTGFEQCEDGRIIRTGPSICESAGSGGSCSKPSPEMGCTSAADCTARPFGRCDDIVSGPGGAGCGCSYGCETDADCPSGQACACGSVGRAQCIPQTCASATDCEADEQCVLGSLPNACSPAYTVQCTTPDDVCSFHSDCDSFDACYPSGGVWDCQTEDCA